MEPEPYNSWGNGSAMRVSPVGWVFDTLEETLEYAKCSAEITHNHPEGIKGAQATATAIFLARTTKDKTKIKAYIEETFGYNLSQTCDEIRPEYKFDVSCQGSVPQAIVAFLESENFEHAIRLAVSLGGDSDTIAAITGSISEAFYGEIPSEIVSQVIPKLPQEFLTILEQHKMLRKSR
ncbi:ADP-ribosylglycohydrolase family protein [Rodentibacter genomosp. 1]|uniref:ADP-ribosylglycohydrolase family protein n=1 Tax=Rodentibacter genomosp. 1 TaxID=1908264 RepID=UPI00244CDED4|nr:ADP-ribosylglycohydrolase family protein [Rodentibacter genomosp. 1]